MSNNNPNHFTDTNDKIFQLMLQGGIGIAASVGSPVSTNLKIWQMPVIRYNPNYLFDNVK